MPAASGSMRVSLRVRDKIIILAALGGVVAICWGYISTLAGDMSLMRPPSSNASAIVGMHPWKTTDFFRMFLMWAVMMVGMMVPTAMRAVLIYATAANRAKAQGRPVAQACWFVSGYAFTWIIFSVGAMGLQWAFEQAGLLSPMMVSSSPNLGAGLLIAAGLYQLTPWKDVCLKHCQSPAMFIATYFRPGYVGAIRRGAYHGAYCVGCCWVLMGLLFLGGVMNLFWIATITVFVLLEKLLPPSLKTVLLTGSLMVGSGIGFLAIA